jgi:hypothetical protein
MWMEEGGKKEWECSMYEEAHVSEYIILYRFDYLNSRKQPNKINQ